VSDERLAAVKGSEARVAAELARLRAARVGGEVATKVMCRPGETYETVVAAVGLGDPALTSKEKARVEILVRYASYIERAKKHLDERAEYESRSIAHVDFSRVASLSTEGREALERARPATLGAAQRLRGVRDSDVAALLVHLRTGRDRAATAA
jgi:tRNA uridine 5-carboxymethylaminomethyl modification enzyme